MCSLSDWDNLQSADLTLYTKLHFGGVHTVLEVLHNAVLINQSPDNFLRLRDHLCQAYRVLEKFSQVIFKVSHTFSTEAVNELSVTLGIKLYTGQILHLTDSFADNYKTIQRSPKAQLILLRILNKLRIPVEKYLVSIRYWELQGDWD